MMQFDFVTLRVFVAVMEERSIVSAADQQHIAASAISKRLSDLEHSLKTPLFLREKNKLVPTPAAFHLLFHARTVLRDLNLLKRELEEFSSGERGRVRLLANISAISEYIPADLRAFSLKYPLVKFELQDAISPRIIRAVSDHAADIGVYDGNFPAPNLHTSVYRTERLVVVMPSGHPLAAKKAVSFAEMVRHDLVRVKSGSTIDALIEQAANRLGETLEPQIRVTGWEAICSVVEAGVGIGVVPEKSARRFGGCMDIEVRLLNEPWATRTLNLCVLSLASLAPAARLFVEHLTASANAAPASPSAK